MHSNVNKAIMTREQVRRAAPSVFAEAPASTVSDRYKFSSTATVLDELADAGWGTYRVSAKRALKEENKGFERHVLWLRHAEQSKVAVGEVVPEIVLTNSHNGDSSFRLQAGLFRLVCSNGLLVASAQVETVRMVHTSYGTTSAIEAAGRVAATFPHAIKLVQAMWKQTIDHRRALELAEEAMAIRFGDRKNLDEGKEAAHWPFEPENLLRLRRSADREPSLWNSFNVIQENVIRGGIRGVTAKGHPTSSRRITSVETLMDVNARLWRLAENALVN